MPGANSTWPLQPKSCVQSSLATWTSKFTYLTCRGMQNLELEVGRGLTPTHWVTNCAESKTSAKLRSMNFFAIMLFALIAFVALWLVCAVISILMARARGAKLLQWILLGFLLGPIGIAVVLKLATSCTSCSAKVLRGIRTCPNCREQIPAITDENNPVGPLWTYRRNW